MTEKEFESLLRQGQNLFAKVVHDLNDVSGQFIHTEPGFVDDTYRREEDWKEICVALALLVRKTTSATQTMPGKVIIKRKGSDEQKTTFVKKKHQHPDKARMAHFLEKHKIRFTEGSDGSYIRVDFTDDGDSK